MTVNDPLCNGICLSASELGVGGNQIAYAHPDCPAHGDPTDDCYVCAGWGFLAGNELLHTGTEDVTTCPRCSGTGRLKETPND